MLTLILIAWELSLCNAHSRHSRLRHPRSRSHSIHRGSISRCIGHQWPVYRYTFKIDDRISRHKYDYPAHHHSKTRTAASRHIISTPLPRRIISTSAPSFGLEVLPDTFDVGPLGSSSIIASSQQSITVVEVSTSTSYISIETSSASSSQTSSLDTTSTSVAVTTRPASPTTTTEANSISILTNSNAFLHCKTHCACQLPRPSQDCARSGSACRPMEINP
ncbi:hypothetical protein DE146DRAFT_361282 [Phaeosphaeria sp. MPI-PUGE-AT-0046c]|nr:hypothetical protein DE146DRAFT_361282 [Phaeosphaeria sp. MPI-PUGE-AT-0046c]